MIRPAVSSFAVWTSGGVWINAAPTAGDPGAGLYPWSEAPLLSAIHPRARRPHAVAVSLVQLAHALLTARDRASGAPALKREEVSLLLGTLSGSIAADFEFWTGTQKRGAAFGSPSTFVYTLPTAPLAEIALALGVRGSIATVTAGASSGIASIARSAAHVASGRARACICGGVEFSCVGDRQPGTLVEREVIALFLVEADAGTAQWPTIRDWQSGFSPENGRSHPVSDRPPLSTLTALASAAVKLGSCSSAEDFFSSSSDGHWARVTLVSPQWR